MKGLSLFNKPRRIEGHARLLFSSIDSSVPAGNLDTTIRDRTGAFYGGATGTTDKLFSCKEQCDE
jgi:hypothetical protein